VNRSIFKTLAWLVALGLLGWLYRMSTQVDSAAHMRTVAQFEQLRQQNARLNQFVLQSRYHLLRNYDVLVQTQDKIRQLLVAMPQNQPDYFGSGNTALAADFKKYQAAFATKFEQVEDFKSHNAVLRNSLSYFPLAVQQMQSQAGVSAQRERWLHQLLKNVLLFDSATPASGKQQIESLLNQLRSQSSQPDAALASLARHVDIILEYQVEVDKLLRDITQSDSAQQGDRLFGRYGEIYTQQQQSADRYRLALALMSVIMLAYVAWTLAALNRARAHLTESLRELEFQKQALDAHSIVSITDMTGKILYTNDKFSEISQYSREELLGQDHRVLNSGYHPHDFFKTMWATIGHGQVWHGEVKNKRKDGSFYWVDSTVVPFLNAQGKVQRYVSVRTDMTERKRVEEAMRDAKEAAERAAQVKSDFLANMSHEIRTPMNGIIGMTNLALETALTDEQREYISLVKSSADSLLSIINDILDFSKIESGKLHIEVIEFSLESTLRDTMKALAMRAHQKHLELMLHVAPDVPDRVLGDPGRLRQVIVNLVGNAIKFTNQGEIEVAVQCEPGASSGQTRLQFSVRDTGIGIAADKFESIFDSFSQADTSTTRKYGGTGLGLTISSQLVDLMGGRIQLESTLGQGSRFYFSLDMPIHSQGALASYQQTGSIRGMPVLVVDDNESNRRLMTQMLHNWHMQATAVASGAEALAELARAKLAGQPYPLALLDVQMPGMDGFELASQIQQDNTRAATIMMITSQGQRGDAQRCRDLGLAAYLTKPVTQSDLLDAIMTTLGDPTLENSPLVTRHTLREDRQDAQPRQRPLKLLLAEDNAVNQRLASVVLGKQGHTVCVAHNGREALALWQEQAFDAILMDVDMPEMNGYEATQRIRALEQAGTTRTPIIAMTAHAMEGARDTCLSHGMDGYVSKPIDMAALQQELSALVADLPLPEHALATPLDSSLHAANIALLRQTVDGDKALFDELVGLYLADAPTHLKRIQNACQQGDADTLRRNAHALKGMISIFDAQQAMALAQQLEDQPQGPHAQQTVQALVQALSELEQALNSYTW